MPPDELNDRITEQFSDRTRRSDIWRAFDLVLDTDAHLNLGYSPPFQPTLLGSSQRRLVEKVGSIVKSRIASARRGFLLDVGCGRGGPARYLADHYGFTVVGVDLVPYNVRCARQTAATTADTTVFVVGDADRLPITSGMISTVVAIDSIVYFPRKTAVFDELARVLERDGVLVLSDLVGHPALTAAERHTVTEFADAWDMPPIWSLDTYQRALVNCGFEIHSLIDITPNSIRRFRKWTHLYRLVTASPVGRVLEWVLRQNDVHPAVIHDQIEYAHHALPSLRHIVIVAHPA